MKRRYVQDGILPPKGAIRVEFVNTDYNYPPPDEGQTFAIHLEGSPSPFGQTDRYEIVRIGIRAALFRRKRRLALTFVTCPARWTVRTG